MRLTSAICCALLAGALNAGTARCATYEVPSDFLTIQLAIEAASTGDTVLVAAGAYGGTGNRNIDFAGREIVLRSRSGAAATVIDCALAGRGIHFHSGETRAAVVEGFTIRRGSVSNSYGGGILCDGSSPMIRDCIVEDSHHAGMNGAGGGICFRNSNALLDGCEIRGCSSAGFGGGIACRGTVSPTISDCVVILNAAGSGGGGIDAGGIGAPRMVRCDVSGNTATGAGGGIVLGGSAVVDGCRITGNLATTGGGIYCAGGGSVAVYATTIAGNRAGSGDGGGFAAFGEVSLERSILWGNCAGGNGDQGLAGDGGIISVACSVIDPPGMIEDGGVIDYMAGNVSLDPLFCGPLSCIAAPTTEGSYSIDRLSPAFPGENPCAVWIGAAEVGCPAAGAPVPEDLERGKMVLAVVPNPACGRFACEIVLPVRAHAVLDLIDAGGRVVAKLFERDLFSGPSILEVETDGDSGKIPAGAYILRITAVGLGTETRRLVLIR